MAKAVCIITETGMKCLASPMKNHFPGSERCKYAEPDARLEERMGLIRAALGTRGKKGDRKPAMDLSDGEKVIIAKVVRLMLAAKVNGKAGFTIVSAVRRPRPTKR